MKATETKSTHSQQHAAADKSSTEQAQERPFFSDSTTEQTAFFQPGGISHIQPKSISGSRSFFQPSRVPTIQAKCAECEAEEQQQEETRGYMPEVQQIPGFESDEAPVQAKLTVGQPGDRYEQEADRVAATVVNRINSPGLGNLTTSQSVQTSFQGNSEFQQRVFRPAVDASVPNVQGDFETTLNHAKGGGSPLDKAFRAKVEPAMGADFTGVKVHTDAEADRLSQSIQAKAFTTGQDIFFRQGTYQPGSQQGQKLLAHELTHVVQQKSQGIRVQRSPLTQEQLENRAELLFNAFETWLTLSGLGTNVSTVFQALEDLTPDDVVALENIYQETYSSRRGGRSLVQDLLYEFENEGPEDLHRVFSLLGRRVERTGERHRQSGQDSPYISAEPMLREVVPGTEVTYRFLRPRFELLSSETIIRSQWFVRYDPESLSWLRQQGLRPRNVVRGPVDMFSGMSSGPLEFQWDFPGRHLVVLEVQIGHQLPTYYEYVQIVRGTRAHAVEAFEQHGTAMQPDIYLAILELERRRLEQQDATRNAERIQQLRAQIEDVRLRLEIPGSLRTETRPGETGPQVVPTEGGPGPARPIRAVLVPTARPESVVLRLFVKQLREGRWAIIDLTDPTHNRVRTYDGSPDSGLQGEAAIPSAIQNAWEHFVRDNQHPAGQLVAEPPEGLGFSRGTRWNVHSNGISTLDVVNEWFSRVGLVTGIGALALSLVPVPGARVVAASLILISAAAGATAATANIVDRLEHGDFEWDVETALDLLDLAGSLAVGVGGAISLAGRVRNLTRLGSTILISEGIDTGSDIASGVILSALHYRRIEAIRRRVPPGPERERQIRSVLEQAISQGGLILLGTVGGRRGRTRIQDFDIDERLLREDSLLAADVRVLQDGNRISISYPPDISYGDSLRRASDRPSFYGEIFFQDGRIIYENRVLQSFDITRTQYAEPINARQGGILRAAHLAEALGLETFRVRGIDVGRRGQFMHAVERHRFNVPEENVIREGSDVIYDLRVDDVLGSRT